MSKQEFECFRAFVFLNSSLQERLRRQTDRDLFIDNVIEIGNAYGFKIAAGDVKAEMVCNRQTQKMDAEITPVNFRNWSPVKIYRQERKTFVDWCYMGKTRFSEPFFEDTVRRQLREPFNLLFRYRTPLEYLKELYEQLPCIAPTGFIFHLSRCGSTLVSQMLAALTENIVISEAAPIDFVIRSQPENSDVSRDERINNLKWLINAFGQKRRAEEKHLFVKFDCWHTLDLELITEAFPDVPRIFLYRSPVEIIVSHLRQPGMQMIPGSIENLMPETDFTNILQMSREEYCARVLGQICDSALKQANGKNALLVNYNELPEAVVSTITEHFKVAYSPENLERMNAAAQFNAKTPQLWFASDVRDKNKEATETVRQAAEKFVAPYYEKLENIRRASAG